MVIVVAGGLTGGDGAIAGKYYGAGKNYKCGEEDTFHVFHFGFIGLLQRQNCGKIILIIEKG